MTTDTHLTNHQMQVFTSSLPSRSGSIRVCLYRYIGALVETDVLCF